MPRQNRVTPYGELIAVPDRGIRALAGGWAALTPELTGPVMPGGPDLPKLPDQHY